MYVESFHSRTHSRGLGGLKNGSGGGQSCQNMMNRIMKIHRPLSPRIRHFLYKGILLLILSLLFYCLYLKVGLIDLFQSLLSKVGVSLGGRALSKCLGWRGGLLVAAVWALLTSEPVENMMADSGANCEKEGTSSSSGSGNWRKYINLSSDKEGDSAPEPSTDRTPGHPPQEGGAPAQPALPLNPHAEPQAEPAPAAPPSALEERANELIHENLRERKGDLGDGQRIDKIRQEVEQDFNIATKGEEFQLIQQLDKEVQAKNEPSPVTNSAFNEIKDHQAQMQDGRGGGRPYERARKSSA